MKQTQYCYICQISTDENGCPLYVNADGGNPTSLFSAAQTARDPTYFRNIINSVAGAKVHRVEATITAIDDFENEAYLVMMGGNQDVLPFKIYTLDKVKLNPATMRDTNAWRIVGENVGVVIGASANNGIGSECEERLLSVEWDQNPRLFGHFYFHELLIVERGEIFTKLIAERKQEVLKHKHLTPKPTRMAHLRGKI